MERRYVAIVGILGAALMTPAPAAVAQGAPSVAPGSVATTRQAVPSAGCGTESATSAVVGDGTGSLDVAGQERTWRIHLPPAHDGVAPVPLVILLHGLGEDAGIIGNFTTTGLPDEAGFAVVAPLGSGVITRWMWDLGTSEYDLSMANPDIGFIAALMDELSTSLCLDESRIYGAGYSNGAIGVSALRCVLEDRLAAVAAVAR